MNVRSSLIFDRSYPFFYPSDILCYTVKNERIHEMILSKKISKNKLPPSVLTKTDTDLSHAFTSLRLSIDLKS